MPDRRRHRGPHPGDADLFAEACVPVLRTAVEELSWLLSRGYASVSALALVGNRHELRERQRTAVGRSSCSDAALASRTGRRLSDSQLAGRTVHVDGFNLLTTIEAALSGGVVLVGRDGCHRDMASMHGNYRRVEETSAAIDLIGDALDSLEVPRTVWWLDRPVSNSGRLATLLRAHSAERGRSWDVELVPDPDGELKRIEDVVVSADSGVVDECRNWFDLARFVVRHSSSAAWIVDLGGGTADPSVT